MKVLYNWIKEFVDLKATPEDLRARLSLSGTAVEALEQTGGPLLDAELTSNRADCLGHTASRARLPHCIARRSSRWKLTARNYGICQDGNACEIESPELCGRYTARVLRGVKVGPSPDWLRQRLEALGQTRSTMSWTQRTT